MGNIPCICIGAKNQRTDVNRRRCALHRATVCLPLRNRATVTEVDVCGETALHSVVTRDGSDICVKCVNLLIRHHADINVRDRDCRSPLHYAVDNEKIEWVKLLLEHGADVNSGDFYYATPLLHAVIYQNPEYVQVLLQYNADVNDCNVLDCAVRRNNVECVKLLLEHGAKTNICNKDNETPLYSALSYNTVEYVKMLLQHGADVNVCDRYNGTPLHCAVDYDKIVNRCKCKRFLHYGANRHACGVYIKYKSIRKNYVECVKLLLQQGAKLDVIDYKHNTALNVAARYCHLEIINLLLEYNANVNTKNLQGQTPLMQAALKVSELNTENNVACLELLIQASGQFDLCNEYNELILKIAHVKKIGEILLPYCVHPRSLQDLCRYQIRSSLHQQFLPDVIPSLNLPNKLQRFLLLQR